MVLKVPLNFIQPIKTTGFAVLLVKHVKSLTTGCLTLLEIYKVSWKFSGLVCEFVVNISCNSCISECISTKYLAVNQDQLILR